MQVDTSSPSTSSPVRTTVRTVRRTREANVLYRRNRCCSISPPNSHVGQDLGTGLLVQDASNWQQRRGQVVLVDALRAGQV